MTNVSTIVARIGGYAILETNDRYLVRNRRAGVREWFDSERDARDFVLACVDLVDVLQEIAQ